MEGYEGLIRAFELPDVNDRHVLAAAVQTRAAILVTNNLRHFPAEYLGTFRLEVASADGFLANIIDLQAPAAVAALRAMRVRLKRPELDAETLLRRMESAGLTETVNLLIGEIQSL